MEKKTLVNIFFITYSLIILVMFYLVFILDSFSSLSEVFYAIGKFSGLVAFLFLATLVILGDFGRLVDKVIGLDSIIKFQKRLALTTLFFVLSHPIFFILSDSYMANYLLPDFSYLPLALGTLSLYMFLIVGTCSILYKRISYNVWQGIHILTYVLFLSSLYHGFEIGTESKYYFMQILYGILFILFIIGVIYRTNIKLKQRFRGNFQIKKLIWETKDTYSLILENKNKIKTNFKAGQFCFLRINGHKLYARHPFTISSAPHSDLRFTIKLNGKFTNIASELKKGDEIILEGPFGIFTNKTKYKNLLFIAGGVGITPFMSLTLDIEKNKNKFNQNVNLIYCTRTKEDIIFRKEFDKINHSWFKKTYILSNEKTKLKGVHHGRINLDILKENLSNFENTMIYLCGPEPLKDAVKRDLETLGFPKKQIKSEDFFW